MDRFEQIKNYRQSLDNAAEQKRLAEEKEYAELTKKVRALKPRIDELIKLGNCCLENGIKISCDGMYELSWKNKIGERCGRRGGFVTEGWSHRVGLLDQRNRNVSKIKEMGIIMGGGCGKLDFHTDGTFIYSTDWHGVEKIAEAKLEHLRQFVNGFDEFESNFTEYIDYVTNTK